LNILHISNCKFQIEEIIQNLKLKTEERYFRFQIEKSIRNIFRSFQSAIYNVHNGVAK